MSDPQQEQKDPEPGRLTIGRVVEALRKEFPDLSISKVRYLEERGLLSPTRTPGGYRTYTEADVRRLRTILVLQRDQFLPLEIIRQRLERGHVLNEHGQHKSASPAADFSGPPGASEPEEPVEWEQALQIAGVDDEYMRQLADYRLVDRQIRSDGEVVLSETDVEIARVCGRLSRFGVEPRNLRLTRSAVEREAAVIEHVAAPSLRSPYPERREDGERIAQEMATLLSRLFSLLLTKDVGRIVEGA